MRKVLVIGPGGAGKSTFALHLGKLLDIEVLHLDKFYWHAGWVETPKPQWLETISKLIQRDAWIMDGNYSGSLDLRLRACDTAIFLDVSRTRCLWRVLKRAARYRKRSRPDVAEGCPERLTLEFILWIWNYPRKTKPKVVKMLKSTAAEKRIVWLRTQADVDKFLSQQSWERANRQ